MFSRRSSAVASSPKQAGTPPVQVIEELKAAIADLKDELDTAQQAKRYAFDNLKKQIEGNEKLEAELVASRRELDNAKNEVLHILAQQSAEVPVMTAPSPNGSSKLRVDLGMDEIHVVSTTEGESIIRDLVAKIKKLETDVATKENDIQTLHKLIKDHEEMAARKDMKSSPQNVVERYKSEIASLKEINATSMTRMRDLLNEKNRLEQELESTGNSGEVRSLAKKIADLEAQLSKQERLVADLEQQVRERDAEIERLIAAAKHLEKDIENLEKRSGSGKEIEELRQQIAALETQLEIAKEVSLQVDGLEAELDDKTRQVTILQRDVEIKSAVIAKHEKDTEAVHKELHELRAEVNEEADRVLALEQKLDAEQNENIQLINRVEQLESHMKEAIEWKRKIAELEDELLVAKDQAVELERQKKLVEENENQVLDLIEQIGKLKVEQVALQAENDSLKLDLAVSKDEASQAASRLEQIRNQFRRKIDETSAVLANAVQASLDARKEVTWWKRRYEQDLRDTTKKLSQLTESKSKASSPPAKERLPLATREVIELM